MLFSPSNAPKTTTGPLSIVRFALWLIPPMVASLGCGSSDSLDDLRDDPVHAAGSGGAAGTASGEDGTGASSHTGATGGVGGMGGTGGMGGLPQTGGNSGTSGESTGGSAGAESECYGEAYHPAANLSDIRDSYAPQQWLDAMLNVLERRYPSGHSLMDQMKTDPWLHQSFPSYFDMSTWEGMIFAVDTACHEETHGWDYEKALNFAGKHAFYLREDLTITAPKLAFFPRNQLLSYVQQGGSVTSFYDDYLMGEQGSYDFIALADEVNAYINGLACATSVGDQFSKGYAVSYRDGVAAHMLFLQYYIKHARTNHPVLFGKWRADTDWQRFVRYSWARAQYWTQESQAFPNYGIDDEPIWARVNQPENLAEIEHFTGESAASVACIP